MASLVCLYLSIKLISSFLFNKTKKGEKDEMEFFWKKEWNGIPPLQEGGSHNQQLKKLMNQLNSLLFIQSTSLIEEKEELIVDWLNKKRKEEKQTQPSFL